MSDSQITGVPPLPGEPEQGTSGVPPGKAWGFWPTAGFSAVILIAGFAAQIVAVFVFAMVESIRTRGGSDLKHLETSGLVLSVATLLCAPVVIGLCVLFAWLRKGIPLKEYLGLNWPGKRAAWTACAVLAVIIIASDTVTLLLGRQIVPEVMVEFYRSAGVVPLLWLAIIVAAPLQEEFLFRGFLFKGLQHSRVGGWGAVLITAAVWAVIHQQYDFYGMGTIFVAGIFLGYVRWKTDSMLLCILLHVLMNLVSTIQVEFLLRRAAE